MTIAIIVAMDKELQLLLPLLSEPRTTVIDGITFYLGDTGANSLIIMKSGIGKVNAALATMQLIRQFAPDLVINTGVAGGTGSDAKILDVVVGTRIAYHDVWCGPDTVEGQAARCPRFFESDANVAALPVLHGNPRVRHGLIASGDVFVADPEVVAHIKSLYPDVLAVDMESAAIAHTCHLMNTPFFCIRVVSDTPGEADNMAQYDSFWEDAPRQSFEIISSLLNSLGE
ncbi:MAG: 5'-methylthioadenosine/adenosylhomocysteine nucleosidase [Muribaculaceae bacterium]|nr:5'-methylthioadenosine/adenosylhomocysteine nucleosidase [Muribaculaceae bacterium]MDE6345063.1 5'-methylthioadenosine/adenosylhomocysteine nucleosidase [Muribaculaceae bacterium]